MELFWMPLQEKGKFWKLDEIIARHSEIIARHSEAQTGCPLTYTYTGKSMEELLGDGFIIKEKLINHIFPYEISKYIRY